jgi:hypothetical protein
MLFANTLTPETTAEHPYLAVAHAKLEHLLAEIDRLTGERDFHNASKMQATRQRNEMLAEGSRVATTLRKTLKDHLGPDNERLTQFGIQPFRSKKRAKKSVDAAAAPPEPPENP